MKNRCEWCGKDPLYISYHDVEWGMPVHDDRHLYEFLVLEGAQAGLSWLRDSPRDVRLDRGCHILRVCRGGLGKG